MFTVSKQANDHLKLPLDTIRQLFRRVLREEAAITIDLSDRRSLMRRLQSRVSSIDGVCVTTHPADADSRSKVLCRFTVPNPEEDGVNFRSDELRLEFDPDHRLRLRFRSRGGNDCIGPICHHDQIDELVRLIQQAYREQKARRRQQQKVHQLRKKSVLAEVRRIAEAESCRCEVTEVEAGFLVSASLDNENSIEVTLPRSEVATALPKLSAAIARLRQNRGATPASCGDDHSPASLKNQ